MRVPPRPHPAAIVAIPAHNERELICACLAALGVQRDRAGAPVPLGSFEALILANNCSDDTARVARGMADRLPYALRVVDCELPPEEAHAGGARRVAMDYAARRLDENGGDGVILTTDADSRAGPTWISAILRAIDDGADAVAGYVDADPVEYLTLGPAFLARGRLEDLYLSRAAEIDARLDPRRHDPWPNHRVHSGANLAVTLRAYRAIGGLPSLPLGEDSALARALEDADLLIRHSMDAIVTTSCRFEGRAPGGAADTMRLRHADPEAECDGNLEAAAKVFRRSRVRGEMRRMHQTDDAVGLRTLCGRLGLSVAQADTLARDTARHSFSRLWRRVEAVSPTLRAGPPLRPSGLPLEIARAERILRRIRTWSPADRADTRPLAGPLWLEAAAPMTR